MVIELTVLSLLVGVVLGEIGQNKYYEYTTTISRELGQGKGILHEAVVANSKGITAAVDCTRCYGLLAASAVVIGNFQRPADAFTRTVECARLSMLPSNRRVAFSGCQSAELTSPTTTLYDNGFAFRNLSISKIFVDAYTSMGQIMYDDYCIAVTESIALQTPFTIGASNAYLTASTTISRMTVASQGSSFVSESPALATELILGSDLIQSMKFSCTTPTAYLKLITHTISASLASELVLESEGYDSFLKSSEAIVGVIAGASVCLWLGFLVFFIFWRRSRARHNGNVHPTLEYQTRSVVDSRYGRIKYSNIRRKPLPQTMPVHKTTQRHSQWRALVAMLCGLICGVAFAIGHHFLYYNVNGQPVTNFRTSQTWFLRIGNLLAILVKLSFVVSTGVAFIQLQWMKIHEVALTVKDIDALSGVLSNVLNFFDTSVWWRFPSLLMLALVFWLTSLVPIFTPGTLNVRPLLFRNTTYMQVPQIDFSNATQWVQQASAVVGATTITEGTIAIRQISMATAVGGQILPIPSSYAPNGTYILNFHGPALKCYNASADVQDAFTYGYEKGISANPLFYVYTSTVDLPSMVEPTGDSKQFPNYLDSTSLDHSRIYIRTQNPPLRAAKHTFSVTECGLYNAAYSVEFAFQGSSQKISVLDVRHLDGVSYLQGDAQLFDSSAPPDFDTFLGHWNRGGSYCGLMAGLASVLVGSLAYLPDEEIFSQEFTSIELLDFNYAALPASILQGNVVELFQNITISMLSRPDFHKNPSDAEWVQVANSVPLSSYVYDSQGLIITYCVFCISTQICVLFGLFAVMKNSGSYQNRYSTFIRATKNEAELRKYNDAHNTALDPRPKELAAATVKVSRPYSLGGRKRQAPKTV